MRALAVFHCVTPMKIWDSMEQKTNKGSMEHKTKTKQGQYGTSKAESENQNR